MGVERSYYADRDILYFDFVDENEAQDFLEDLRKTLKTNGMVSVGDAKDLLDFRTTVGDGITGWFSLDGATIYPSTEYFDKGGFRVTLPGVTSLHEYWKNPKFKVSSETKVDMVNHPSHYQSETGLEVFDVIEAFTFDLKGIEAVDTGNVIKYICRWKKKNGLEDLEKARWYLNRLIDHVQKLEEENKK